MYFRTVAIERIPKGVFRFEDRDTFITTTDSCEIWGHRYVVESLGLLGCYQVSSDD
jgi:hypothetical protein